MMFPETHITLRPRGSQNLKEQTIVKLMAEKEDHYLAFPLNSAIREPLQYPKYAWEQIGQPRTAR